MVVTALRPGLARLGPLLPPDSRAGWLACLEGSRRPRDGRGSGCHSVCPCPRATAEEKGRTQGPWGPCGRENWISGFPPGSAPRSLSMKSVGWCLCSARDAWSQRGLLNAVSSCRPCWQMLLRQDALSRDAPVPRVVPLQGCSDSWARSKVQACKVPAAEGAAENPAMTEQAGPLGQTHSEVWAQVATHKTEVTRQILNSWRM